MHHFSHIDPALVGSMCHESVEVVIRRVAEAQGGVIGRAQLRALGLTKSAIDHRVSNGALAPTYAGVYALGHRVLTRHGRWMAAILACGPGAVLSHRDAAALWGIRPDNRPVIDVTAPRHRRGPAGVIVHRARLPPDEHTVRHGIPTTSLFRTLLDLTRVTREGELRKAMNEAERQGLGDTLSLTSFLSRHQRHPGTAKLRAIRPTTRLTRSQLEDAFLAYCGHHALPLPQTNATVLGYEVDCLWRDHHLVAELDGHDFHRTRIDLVDDHTKDQDLQASGLRVTRVNQEHLRTPRLADRLRAMMRASHPRHRARGTGPVHDFDLTYRRAG